MLNEMMEEQCGLRKERTEIEILFEQYAELEASVASTRTNTKHG